MLTGYFSDTDWNVQECLRRISGVFWRYLIFLKCGKSTDLTCPRSIKDVSGMLLEDSRECKE